MCSIVTTGPLELLSIDYLTIEVQGKKQNILVILDHFTKFASAICTVDQKAKTVAKALWSNFFMIYGFPKRILSDRGQDFESHLLRELCELAGIKKCRTSPYHPSGNPVERWNRTLIGMIRSLEDEKRLTGERVCLLLYMRTIVVFIKVQGIARIICFLAVIHIYLWI